MRPMGAGPITEWVECDDDCPFCNSDGTYIQPPLPFPQVIEPEGIEAPM